MYVYTDDDGRIWGTSTFPCYDDQFEFDEDFDFDRQNDYKIVDGELQYDPIERPEPEPTIPDSEVITAVSMLMSTMSIDTMSTINSQQVATLRHMWPQWSDKSVGYKRHQIVRDASYECYRCNQDHTSSTEYNLTVASLWTHIEIAPDGILIWQPPTGAHDAWNIGDKCHYPDADEPIYTSKIDGNTTIPGSDERWWSQD